MKFESKHLPSYKVTPDNDTPPFTLIFDRNSKREIVMIIESEGIAWSGALPITEHQTITSHLATANIDDTAAQLLRGNPRAVDYNGLSQMLNSEIIGPECLARYEKQLSSKLGINWKFALPKTDSTENAHLTELLIAVKKLICRLIARGESAELDRLIIEETTKPGSSYDNLIRQ